MPNKSLSTLLSLSKEQLAATLELTKESPSPEDTPSWLEHSPEGLENALFHVTGDLQEVMELLDSSTPIEGEELWNKLDSILLKLVNLQGL